jgi:endonuclease/exonuclease/phosphatase (EEP) superfamily protein YafD
MNVLTEKMEAVLQQQNLNWNLNNAFFYRGNATGVLLASVIAPLASCGQRTREPVIGIPKTVLFARYAIKHSDTELLVVNVHGINITLGTGTYQKQFNELAAVLQKHDGPLIVAGDFNHWNDGRIEIIANLVKEVGLQKVSFDEERRTTFLGEYVDQIFYRGLIPIRSRGYSVDSSDHNPISVRFRLAENVVE